MKNKLNLTAKTTSKLTLKHTFLYAAASLGIAAILFTGAFLYFNLGNSEEAKAAPGLVSKANGTWYNANTWNNWSNPSLDNQPEWQAGTFYINHHVTYGDLTLKSGNTLIVEGVLEVNSIESNNQLRIEVKKGGKLIVHGDIKGKADFKLYIDKDASLIANNILGDNNLKIYNKGSLRANGDIRGKADFDLHIDENASLSVNNILGDNQLKIYNKGSLLANGDIIGKENFDLHVYEQASLKVNNISGGNQLKIYNSGKFNAQGEINASHNFGITTSDSFEVGSITAGNQFKINNSGTFVSLGDMISGNNTTISNNDILIVIGDIDSQNQLTIDNGGQTVVTGDITTKNNFKSDEEDLYIYGNILKGNHPHIAAQWDDYDLMRDDKPLYDLVQQLLNGGSLLPIVLSDFQASITGSQTVQVEWSTFSEKDNDFFTVERSADGKNFEVLTTVEGAGSSNKKLSYSYEDKKPLTGYNYYRLKQTDFNGDFEYFKIVGVNNSHGQEASLSAKDIHINDVWPNPFTDHLNISFDADGDGEVEFLVQNVYGEVVHKTLFPFSYGENTYAFDRTANLKPGIYFVTIGENGKKLTTQKVIKM